VLRPRTRLLAVSITLALLALGCGSDADTPDGDLTTDPPAASPDPSPSPTEPASPAPTEPLDEEPPPPAYQPPAPDDALERAAWVHLFDDALKTRAGIERVVADLLEADATAVVAEVVRRHDSYYTSSVLPRTPDPAIDPDLDALETLLEVARPAGLEVHAWVPVAPTWHATYEDLPAPAGWVSAEHGRSAPEADRWVSRTVDGDWDEYLDPALPEVREHTLRVVEELAADYEVDGIHLDYVRYASARHGYHPRALARYQEETGTSGVPAPEDPVWSSWRRDQVTELVRATREAIDASGTSPVFSIAVISWGDGPGGPATPAFSETRAFTDALQDWERWAEEGLVDALLPMNYFREADAAQAGWLRHWLSYQAELAERTGTRIVPGIAGYLNAPSDALTQVQLATEQAGAAAMYSYQQSTLEEGRPLWSELAATSWGASPG
jgi:uncharacterized lipoprotein YddW (UPF0748 family)